MAKEKTAPSTTLTIKRTFSAPRERVFRAWTDPKELARWFAPTPDHAAVVPEFDFKVGGKYQLEMHHKGGNIHRMTGTYLEIVPPEKVVFSWIHEPNVPYSIVTVEFRDLGSSTEITLTHEQLPNVEERDKHSQGWNGCLDSLAKYF